MEKKIDSPKEKRNILEEEGSSRAVLSGTYSFVFALLGSLLLWIFIVFATGNPGLAYYGEIFALLGIFQIFVNGFSQSFIAKVKSEYIKDQNSALSKAASYTKVMIVIGGIMAVFALFLYFIIPDPFIQICLLMAIPPLILSYFFCSLGNIICVKNRYDVSGFIGSIFGIVVFFIGGLFILFNVPPVFFTLIPLTITLCGLSLTIYFYKRISPFKLRDLYFKGKMISNDAKEFTKYSTFSTLTNLESIGLLGNLIVFMTTLSLFIWHPSIESLAVQILTIVMAYAIVKVAIIFFCSPLNVEIAEAYTKHNHEIIQHTITDIGRIACLIGLTLTTFVCAGSGLILGILHKNMFLSKSGEINQSLLMTSQILLILCAIGQTCYGFAALFGNALIGSGHAKYSAIGFGITIIITLILTPINIYFFGFLGAGITMLLTGLFILPYMLITLKKKLEVKLKLRALNQIPYLIIVFLLIFFYPIEGVLEHLSKSNNYLIGFIGLIMLLGIVLSFVIGIPFFGVMGPGDNKIVRDVMLSLKLKVLGEFAIKMGRFFYYLNPMHKKKKI